MKRLKCDYIRSSLLLAIHGKSTKRCSAQIFNIVAPLFIIVGVGYFYGARVRPEMRITNQLVMDVFVPALIFHVMVQESFHPSQYTWLVVGGTLLMLGSGVAGYVLARVVGISPRAVMPPAMFSNWANLGVAALYSRFRGNCS